MKTKKTLMFLFTTVLVLLMILTNHGIVAAAPEKPLPPIKIGLIQSTSGMAGQWGVECLEGFNIRMNEINAKGGVKTKEGLRKIEVIVRDDQMKPDIGLKEAKSLILEEKCSLCRRYPKLT
jgi:branched-chain amino acid transport system substrate-binding protein